MQRWQRCAVVSRVTASGLWPSGSCGSSHRGFPRFVREFQHRFIAARRRGPSEFRAVSLRPLRHVLKQSWVDIVHKVMKFIAHVLAALLLLLMAVLSGGAALRESITVDEIAHIGAGVSYLQKLDMRMNVEHPPLAKVLAATPLVLHGVHTDYSDVSWSFSNRGWQHILGEWAWGHSIALRWNDPYALAAWVRAPMLLLTLVLGLCIYLCASQLGGPWGGLLCLVAFVSTPAFLVFGPLVVTDIAVTLFSLLALWRFASLWRTPSRRNAIVFGLLLGAAFLSKFSSGLLLFGFLAFRLSLRFWPLPGMPADRSELRVWRKNRGRSLWAGIGVAALTVYVVYLVLSWNEPSNALDFLGHGLIALVLRRLLMPPFIYFFGLFFFAVSSTRVSFILGHNYAHGVWFYFPVLFLLKSTLAFLLMLVGAVPVALLAKSKTKGSSLVPTELQFHWRAMWTFLLVFVAACLLSPMTISIRHFSVPITLLILMLAPVPRALALLSEKGWRAARLAKIAYVVLALACLTTMVRTYPYYFPYVNSLGLGRPAYALVSDSNLDWNQALPEVNQLVQRRGLSHVLLDEYGFIDTTAYVPQSQFWNCQQPTPADGGQWAIVSADMIEDAHNCLWLLHYPHEALAGGSVYLFRLPAVIPPVGDPAGPPPESEMHSFGLPSPGNVDSRLIFFKCVRDPDQLQPTWDSMMAQYRAEQEKRKQMRGH